MLAGAPENGIIGQLQKRGAGNNSYRAASAATRHGSVNNQHMRARASSPCSRSSSLMVPYMLGIGGPMYLNRGVLHKLPRDYCSPPGLRQGGLFTCMRRCLCRAGPADVAIITIMTFGYNDNMVRRKKAQGSRPPPTVRRPSILCVGGLPRPTKQPPRADKLT